MLPRNKKKFAAIDSTSESPFGLGGCALGIVLACAAVLDCPLTVVVLKEGVILVVLSG